MARIYRCDTATDCDAAGDWTTSYDTSETGIYSLVFDSTHGVLYAGSLFGGIIYRCNTATNCDAARDWTTSYNSSESYIASLAFDVANGILYAGTTTSGLIYRCDTATNCDAAGDWTTSFDATETEIDSLFYESLNGALYARSGTADGIIYRKDENALGMACSLAGSIKNHASGNKLLFCDGSAWHLMAP